jgi:hypothetical protein
MQDAVSDEERAYWTEEARCRALAVKAAQARGDVPHLIAGAELRLREANERLAAMQVASAPEG